MAQFGFETTAEEVAHTFAGEIRGKTGKLVLITGVSPGGLGAEAARAISLGQPGLLILAGRNTAKVRETEKAINTSSPHVPTRCLKLDLSSQKQIREAAAEVNSYKEPVDRLINNAAIMAAPYSVTEDGLEAQFGTNYVGHFLFTNLIMPKILEAGQGARVVNVSSSGHHLEGIRFDDYGFSGGKTYQKWKAYGQAKTANILFSVALVEKLEKRGILAYSLHPGGIRTNLQDHLSKEDQRALGWIDENGNDINGRFTWKTIGQGAATHIVAAFDPRIVGKNGSYLQDGHVDNDEDESYAKDKEVAVKLWALTEDLVCQKFDYSIGSSR